MSKSAAAFMRSEELTLPSGLTVEVRRPDTGRLVMESETGVIPTFLVNQVIGRLVGKAINETTEWIPTQDDLPGLNRFMDMVVKAALVWPVIVTSNPDYEAGQIVMSDLSEEDRSTLFVWGLPGGSAAVQRFRTESGGSVGAA